MNRYVMLQNVSFIAFTVIKSKQTERGVGVKIPPSQNHFYLSMAALLFYPCKSCQQLLGEFFSKRSNYIQTHPLCSL